MAHSASPLLPTVSQSTHTHTHLLLLQYLGDLFLVQQAVNLLGRVLDTPDSITAAPDHIGSLYKSVSAL